MSEIDKQVTELRKASTAVFLATEETVADDLSRILRAAADRISAMNEALEDFQEELRAIAAALPGFDNNSDLVEHIERVMQEAEDERVQARVRIQTLLQHVDSETLDDLCLDEMSDAASSETTEQGSKRGPLSVSIEFDNVPPRTFHILVGSGIVTKDDIPTKMPAQWLVDVAQHLGQDLSLPQVQEAWYAYVWAWDAEAYAKNLRFRIDAENAAEDRRREETRRKELAAYHQWRRVIALIFDVEVPDDAESLREFRQKRYHVSYGQQLVTEKLMTQGKDES